MTKFKLKIITPQGIYQEVEIDQINLDTTAGQIGILAHHIPLASGVKVSQMNYIIDGKRTYFSVLLRNLNIRSSGRENCGRLQPVNLPKEAVKY